MQIKVRTKTYEAIPGDYVFYNGACYQFCAGDSRVLRSENWTAYTSVVLTATAVSKLPLSSMRKVGPTAKGYTFWYFE